ncbi:nucleoside phosphorylase domain-containing protein [Coniochaeta sp. 2T2.1]|nr:nucleoside phosphorylase domain-containing protein [Coniochaeta sp. 2T2.1]
MTVKIWDPQTGEGVEVEESDPGHGFSAINSDTSDSKTPFSHAGSQAGRKKEADVDTQRREYGTALLAASEEGHEEIVEMLLEKGADVNTQGGDYGTALQAASAGGHEEIVVMLLEKGADVNTQGGDYGTAPGLQTTRMARRRLRREEYTVGWVCALETELAASQEMFDEEHQDLERDEHDSNLYSLGRIGDHNVVIVCLPSGSIGNNPAATVAMQLRATFRSLRFGLMVGVGGGVPGTEADIRLGDVVVSSPRQSYPGVVQYDSGKATPSGFERTGFLNSPPPVLLGAVAMVQANHRRQRSQLSEHISKLYRLPNFRREAAGPDILFEATYNHEGGQNCQPCRLDKRVNRQSRKCNSTVVHYGTIASGNQVMRDAALRDRLSAELGGVLCFEMEAAGLMGSFPCLIIRGICDYSDSHKNKAWQPYAAGAAAAYAKEVLLVIPKATAANASTVHGSVNSSIGGTSAGIQLPTTPSIVGQGFFASPESLCRAIQESDLDGVRALIASCSDSMESLLAPVPVTDDPGSGFISRWKDYWGISMLERKTTALHCAVESDGERSPEILRVLLRALPRRAVNPIGYISIVHGINTSPRASGRFTLAPDDGGRYLQSCTALTWAAMLGNIEAVHALKGAGADVNSRDNWLRVTALMGQCFLAAATGREVEVTISLLTGGAHLDLQDRLGNTALHLALVVGNSDVAMALLNAGASTTVPNHDGLRAYDTVNAVRGLSEEVRQAILARRWRR